VHVRAYVYERNKYILESARSRRCGPAGKSTVNGSTEPCVRRGSEWRFVEGKVRLGRNGIWKGVRG